MPTIEPVALARELWSAGYQRAEIARRTGIPAGRITAVCSDLPKPIEHRGRRRPGWAANFHLEDFEDE